MRRRGRVTPMVRTVVKMFVQGVDTTGAPRVEASLYKQASFTPPPLSFPLFIAIPLTLSRRLFLAVLLKLRWFPDTVRLHRSVEKLLDLLRMKY